MPGGLPFGPLPTEGDESLLAVDDMTRVVTDYLTQTPIGDPTDIPPEDQDATAMGVPPPQLLVPTQQPRVVNSEAVQQMILALGKGLKTLQTGLSQGIAATYQTAELIHAQGMRRDVDLQNNFKRIEEGTGQIAMGTQGLLQQMSSQTGTLVAMDKALDLVLKNIDSSISKVQETTNRVSKEVEATAKEQSLNELLKAINTVLNSQRIKLDTIEELLQVVEDRGSQRETPARRGWTTSELGHQTPEQAKEDVFQLGVPQAQSTRIGHEYLEDTPRRQSTPRKPGTFQAPSPSERSPSPTPKRPSIPKEARARRPDKFNGKRGREAEAFLTKMEAHFADYDDFPISDTRKIWNMLTNMAEGKANDWAQPLLQKLLQNENHEFFQNWQVFRKAFLDSFADPVKKEKAVRELATLKQTKSAQDYATHFRTLALEVNWNEEALIDKFKEGLKPEVRAEVTRMAIYSGSSTDNWTLDNWVIFAGKADDMVFTNSRGNHKKESQDRSNHNTSNTDRGKAATISKPSTSSIVKIPDEEKKRQQDKGLCLKCAKPGHMIKHCKGKWTDDANTNTDTVKGKAAKTPSEYSSDSENE